MPRRRGETYGKEETAELQYLAFHLIFHTVFSAAAAARLLSLALLGDSGVLRVGCLDKWRSDTLSHVQAA